MPSFVPPCDSVTPHVERVVSHRKVTRRLGRRSALTNRWSRGRNPVNLFPYCFVRETLAPKNALDVFDHFRMSAQVRECVLSGQSPLIDVLPQQVIHSASFSIPCHVFPCAAYRRDVGQPRCGGRNVCDLLVVPKFPRVACPIQKKQPVSSRESS